MKIEKNIPIPSTQGGFRWRKFPFNEMEIDESIFLEGRNIDGACAAHAYGRNHGLKFKARTVEGGIRIWRIS